MKIDDYVKHIFREHIQEADHWAILETERTAKIMIEGVENTEGWKVSGKGL